VSKRGAKPSKKAYASQRIGCYCYSMNCLCRQSGEGCVACETRKELDEQFLMQNQQTGSLSCTCDVCNCSCSVVFPRDKRYDAAMEGEKIRRGNQQAAEGEFTSWPLVYCLVMPSLTRYSSRLQMSQLRQLHISRILRICLKIPLYLPTNCPRLEVPRISSKTALPWHPT